MVEIQTLFKYHPTGRIYARLVWEDAEVTEQPVALLHKRCPGRCVACFEGCLLLTYAPSCVDSMRVSGEQLQ
jgi:hypothetical protein